MGKPTGFLEFGRKVEGYQAADERLKHWKEFTETLPETAVSEQGARCMDCGIPFCHWGCPVNNVIPEWNDLVYRGRWQEAISVLHRTNNLPEITGRVCPAPCEASCVLGINDDPVSIKLIEKNIVERAWTEGWIAPQPAAQKSGKKVAVVGSGPAGLASAQQLARAGHDVTLFEKSDRIGGLLRYGIPDFKLEKWVIDRRMAQMEAEGVVFKTGVNVGVDISADELKSSFDAVCLTGGAMKARDLQVPGRELGGIHLAMEYLAQSNRRVAGDTIGSDELIDAKGKHVVVIGGGDTGSDCVGTANRQGAASVLQIELLPKPPEERDPATPWPLWPNKLRTSSSHEEGCERLWSINTVQAEGSEGRVTALVLEEVSWSQVDGRWQMTPVEGSRRTVPADLVFLAMGFTQPVHEGLLSDLGVAFDGRNNVQVDEAMMTSIPGVFAAGDMARGASLVVRAIMDGRRAAKGIDTFLMGSSKLP